MHDIVSRIGDYLAVFLGELEIEFGLPLDGEIPRDRLDFSLESLQVVDQYLDRVRKVLPTLPEQQVVNLTLAAGIYAGEVIRRNAAQAYSWLNYDEYFDSHPEMVGLFPPSLGTSAVLTPGGEAMTLPINKVSRSIHEGPENNLHYYASLEVKS